MESLIAKFFNVIIKNDFIVFSNIHNSFFFAIFKDFSLNKNLPLSVLLPKHM